MDMKLSGLPASNSSNSCVLRMLVHKFLCNGNDKRGLIGLCLVVTSQVGQIRDP